MRNRRHNRFRLMLLRWHRRVGVVIACLVILLVLTGIPLNHTADWALDRVTLRSPWLLAHYGIEAPEVRGFPLAEQWVLQVGSLLFLDDTEVARCDSALVGALASGEVLIVACATELLFLTTDGRLIERVGSAHGLPAPLTGLASAQGQVWMQGGAADWYVLDSQRLSWRAVPPGQVLQPLAPNASIPDPLRGVVQRQVTGESLTLERVLLDLHSGRLFGRAGVWIMDLAGLLLLVIALSGCYVWLSKPGRFRPR